MTIELFDQIIERVPRLRELGVTHFSVDPATGACSMILGVAPPAPKLGAEEEPEKQAAPYNDGSTYGLAPGAAMPPTFRERAGALQVK
jgi:hypothetical protein